MDKIQKIEQKPLPVNEVKPSPVPAPEPAKIDSGPFKQMEMKQSITLLQAQEKL